MPIHEDNCAECQKTFEELILRKSEEEEVACPTCKSRRVNRLISRPAAARSGGGGALASAPSCGLVGWAI